MMQAELGGERLRLRDDAVTWREIDGEIVALASGNMVYLNANPSGTLLWGLLAQGCSRHDLVDTLVSTYGVSERQATDDVDTFVAQVAAQGLLER
jgi:hypothetical protein